MLWLKATPALPGYFRSCIGQRFAKLELNVLMVKVIQNFRIEYDGEDIGIRTSFVAAPDKPVVLKFIER